MRPIRIAAVTLLPALAPFHAALAQAAPEPRTPIDWPALSGESVALLSDYLKVNTTNPPGNELAGARFLKAVLDREGIEAMILDTAELGPGRANLYARLRGNGSKKAIALVNHLDVVPATPQFWSVDPFSGMVKDGYVWGRGALDMRGHAIAQLMAMVALKRSGVPLTRDIVFIGNADEESGSTGAITFTRLHKDLLADVEFLMTEGGGNEVRDGVLRYYGVGVAEKRPFWQRLTVHGVPSHGSRPTKQNPVPKLVAALNRIATWETPLHVTPGVAKYFHDIATGYTGERRTWLLDVDQALRTSPRARAWILSDVGWNAMLRNTISLTVLSGSNKTNVIPAEATAELDIRLLPDQDPAAFLAELEKVAGDTAVHFTTISSLRTPLENPIDTDLFHALERAARERNPGALVTTPILSGYTDRSAYRASGIITYGVDPFRVEASESARGVHGNDERLSVENVGFGVHYLYDVLRYVQ
jgi:acetylornithine deacetylase/succinyl-diaminopimelate desuccinylase-like protein